MSSQHLMGPGSMSGSGAVGQSGWIELLGSLEFRAFSSGGWP